MRKFGVLAALVVFTLTGCGQGEEADVNPGQGEDVPGDVGEEGGEEEGGEEEEGGGY